MIFFLLTGSRMLGAASVADELREQSSKVLWDLTEAFQNKDANRFMDGISRRYQSGNPAELEANLQQFFLQMGRIELNVTADSVICAPDGKTLAVKTHWQKRLFPKDSYQLQLFEGKTELVFGREDERVKLQSARGDVLFG